MSVCWSVSRLVCCSAGFFVGPSVCLNFLKRQGIQTYMLLSEHLFYILHNVCREVTNSSLFGRWERKGGMNRQLEGGGGWRDAWVAGSGQRWWSEPRFRHLCCLSPGTGMDGVLVMATLGTTYTIIPPPSPHKPSLTQGMDVGSVWMGKKGGGGEGVEQASNIVM